MIPLSLYIHMPWCVKKCPYCDFNSHKSPANIPEDAYINALLRDLDAELAERPANAPLTSIFIGGGTPSLFEAKSYEILLNGIQNRLSLDKSIEITLEANPGTIDFSRFHGYRTAGINRLSLGIQSFNREHLKALGRIHDDKQARLAIEQARLAGFDNLNLDLMHGLPNQSIAEGLHDLRTACDYNPEHLSWYQLTIEPNTLFYKYKPTLPHEDEAFTLEQNGLEFLTQAGFTRYEISAFSKPQRNAIHNLNYWLFGDYYGIGAGAHGKWTSMDGKTIYRTRKQRQPADYLNPQKPILSALDILSESDCVLEFMLNTTRLHQPISHTLFTERTNLPQTLIMPGLIQAQQKGFVTLSQTHWELTPLGKRFTNDLQALFLP